MHRPVPLDAEHSEWSFESGVVPFSDVHWKTFSSVPYTVTGEGDTMWFNPKNLKDGSFFYTFDKYKSVAAASRNEVFLRLLEGRTQWTGKRKLYVAVCGPPRRFSLKRILIGGDTAS